MRAAMSLKSKGKKMRLPFARKVCVFSKCLSANRLDLSLFSGIVAPASCRQKLACEGAGWKPALHRIRGTNRRRLTRIGVLADRSQVISLRVNAPEQLSPPRSARRLPRPATRGRTEVASPSVDKCLGTPFENEDRRFICGSRESGCARDRSRDIPESGGSPALPQRRALPGASFLLRRP